MKFFRKGWKAWKIEHALNVLNSAEINPEALSNLNQQEWISLLLRQ